jgi:hypothetical protein
MKLVKEHLNQYYLKFTNTGDPVHDMGIGIESQIKDWLAQYNIHQYALTKKFSINVYTSIDFSNKSIKQFPDYIKFNHIIGGFHCEHSDLISLKGGPYSVTGSFLVRYNNLKNLINGPVSVKGIYSISYNGTESLEGLAKFIEGAVYLSHNNLKSLEGVPKIIKGEFAIHDNPIKTLKYFPEEVEGDVTFSPSDIITKEKILNICKVGGEIKEYN